MLLTLKNYLASRWGVSLVIFYAILSTFLKFTFGINTLIPCFWKSVFNIECPGCGLSRAFMCLVQLNFEEAYHFNKLIFIILPASLYYVITDFIKFKEELT